MSGEMVSVWLVGFHPDTQATAAAGIVEAFGIDLAAAQRLVDSLPAPVKKSATHEQAAHYAEALRAIGGEVSIRSPMFETRVAPLTNPPPKDAYAPSPAAAPSPASAPSAAQMVAIAPPIATAAPPIGEAVIPTRVRHGQVCVAHPETDASFYCDQCSFSFCDDCVDPRPPTAVCRRCHKITERYVEPRAVTTINDYGNELGPSFTFFTRKDVLLLLIGTAIIVWPISAMAAMPANIYGFLGAAIQFGLEAALFLHLIRQVGYNVGEINPPDFTTIWDDMFVPALRYVVACLPMIAAFIWTATLAFGGLFDISQVGPNDAVDFLGPAILAIVGFLIWPITTLLAAMSSSLLSVLNPIEWFKAIRSIGTPLLVGAPIFYAFIVFEFLVIGSFAEALLAVPIIGRLLALFVSYVALAVRARLLGALTIGRI